MTPYCLLGISTVQRKNRRLPTLASPFHRNNNIAVHRSVEQNNVHVCTQSPPVLEGCAKEHLSIATYLAIKLHSRLFSATAYKHNPLPLQRCLVKSGEFLLVFRWRLVGGYGGFLFLGGRKGARHCGFLVLLACV